MEIKMSASEMHTLVVSKKLNKTSSWETLRFEGSKIVHCSPRDQRLSYFLCSRTKKQNRAEIPVLPSGHFQLHALIICNSGQHFPGNSDVIVLTMLPTHGIWL